MTTTEGEIGRLAPPYLSITGSFSGAIFLERLSLS